MEKKINIAELLKDCPKGMELDCTMYDNVTFVGVVSSTHTDYPIRIKTESGFRAVLTEYGQNVKNEDAKCVIFPKGKTTWEGFQRPFKDGDIIFTHANCLKVGLGNTWISIYQENRNGGVATYVDCAEDGSDYYSNIDGDKPFLCMEKDIMRQRLATEEEKQKLFEAIKDHGYKWNPETKTLDKLVEPKFKVGDKVRHKTYTGERNIVTEIKDTHYILDDELALPFISQDDYELVPNKFDINTLVPFKSEVLVRDNKLQRWYPAIWGFYDNTDTDYPYKLIGCISHYCIPYEDNEHLLGTTNDCDEYYKTWE